MNRGGSPRTAVAARATTCTIFRFPRHLERIACKIRPHGGVEVAVGNGQAVDDRLNLLHGTRPGLSRHRAPLDLQRAFRRVGTEAAATLQHGSM